ncbi:MAG: hypothetical protein ACQEQF_05070 [Bacillota bacterium]
MLTYLFSLFFLILFIPIKFIIEFQQIYLKQEQRLSTKIILKVDIFLFYEFTVYERKKEKKRGSKFSLKKIRNKKVINYNLLKKIKIDCLDFDIKAKLGLGDAYLTALFIPLFYVISSLSLKLLNKFSSIKKVPDIEVNSIFDGFYYKLYFKGIFRSYLGYIIFVVMNIIYLKIKGGAKKWMEDKLKN